MHPFQTVFWKAATQGTDKKSITDLRKLQAVHFKLLTCKTSRKAFVPGKKLSYGMNLTFFRYLSAFIGSPSDIYMVK